MSNACVGRLWQSMQSIFRRSPAISRLLYTTPFADTHGRSCRSVSAAMYSMFLQFVHGRFRPELGQRRIRNEAFVQHEITVCELLFKNFEFRVDHRSAICHCVLLWTQPSPSCFGWIHMPPIDGPQPRCGCDLDRLRFCFFFLRQNDLQTAVPVLAADLVSIDCSRQCE